MLNTVRMLIRFQWYHFTEIVMKSAVWLTMFMATVWSILYVNLYIFYINLANYAIFILFVNISYIKLSMNILVLLNEILFHIQMACEWIPICTFPLVLDATITISLWLLRFEIYRIRACSIFWIKLHLSLKLFIILYFII